MSDDSEDPHEVLHVYEGDGGVIIRENGNVSTFGFQSPEVSAAFNAASASLPADAAELVERLEKRANFFDGIQTEFGAPTSTLDRKAASLIQSQAAEIARCHARLEIDHEFVPHPDRPTDTVDDLVRVEIPMADRINAIDGIEARDATIKEQDQQIDAMRARIAELEAGLEPFAYRYDAWGDVAKGPYTNEDYSPRMVADFARARALLNRRAEG